MLGSHLKIAFKVLRRRPFFTFASLFGIAVTLTVLLLATALLDHVFAPQPPESRLGRTLGVYQIKLRGPEASRTGPAGYGLLDRHVRTLPGAEAVSIIRLQRGTVSYVDGRRVELYLKRTDAAFWRILDFSFVEGEPYTVAETRRAEPVAVINASTRERLFGGAPAVGRSLEVEGRRYRVVGVVENVSLLRLVSFADVWVPISTLPSDGYRRAYSGDFIALVLAASREEFPALKAEYAYRLARAEIPGGGEFETISGGLETLFEAVSRMLFSSDFEESHPERLAALLGTLALLFMMLPAVNLINLNLSRILERRSEIGVRKAFGGSSAALVGQFLIESVTLTLTGGLLALPVSAGLLAAINASDLIPYAELAINLRVFATGLALAVVFGVLAGVYPAWRMSRLHPAEALAGRSS